MARWLRGTGLERFLVDLGWSGGAAWRPGFVTSVTLAAASVKDAERRAIGVVAEEPSLTEAAASVRVGLAWAEKRRFSRTEKRVGVWSRLGARGERGTAWMQRRGVHPLVALVWGQERSVAALARRWSKTLENNRAETAPMNKFV
jgi:hypothetical protein